jgi:hypothetical protein
MYRSSGILHLAEVDKEEHITQISWKYHPILQAGHFHLLNTDGHAIVYGPERRI